MKLTGPISGNIKSVISGGTNERILNLKTLPTNLVITSSGKPLIDANGNYVIASGG